ncbi:hypothetical protein KI387_034942, partial [Taxus chinensis]
MMSSLNWSAICVYNMETGISFPADLFVVQVSILLAIVHMPLASGGLFSVPEEHTSNLSGSHWSAYFHQVSLGTTLRQEHLAVLDAKLASCDSDTNKMKDTSLWFDVVLEAIEDIRPYIAVQVKASVGILVLFGMCMVHEVSGGAQSVELHNVVQIAYALKPGNALEGPVPAWKRTRYWYEVRYVVGTAGNVPTWIGYGPGTVLPYPARTLSLW